jgi:hypothetical protein
MIEGTTVIRESELAILFPEGEILVESISSTPNSYTAYKIPLASA